MIHKALRCLAATLTAVALTASVPTVSFGQQAETTTPIKHIVVIFDENITFDHYFATYPNAANPQGESKFSAKDDTLRSMVSPAGYSPRTRTAPMPHGWIAVRRSHAATITATRPSRRRSTPDCSTTSWRLR